MLTIHRLDLSDARILIEGAAAKAREIGVPMCIAITDEGESDQMVLVDPHAALPRPSGSADSKGLRPLPPTPRKNFLNASWSESVFIIIGALNPRATTFKVLFSLIYT